MIRYIVYNKDFEEYVSSENPLKVTNVKDMALIFDDDVKAEEVRQRVQKHTGNRWRVMDDEV